MESKYKKLKEVAVETILELSRLVGVADRKGAYGKNSPMVINATVLIMKFYATLVEGDTNEGN